MTEEDRFQIAVAKYLDYLGLCWAHPPNGGKRNMFEAVKFKRMGVKAGLPDVLIFEPNDQHCGLAIELKVGKNGQTPNQKAWQAMLEERGWRYAVCKSFDEFERTLRDYQQEKV